MPTTVINEYLATVPAEQHALIQVLDSIIRQGNLDLVPSLKWRNLTYHHARNVCAIVSHSQHINLQIWDGVYIKDPHSLLRGTGKSMRHIQFKTGDKIRRAAVAAIVKQAAQVARPE